MHKKVYGTPEAKAIAALCEAYKGAKLMHIYKGEWQVNANELSRAMFDHKPSLDLEQGTITRILNGSQPKRETVALLAKFFGVRQAVVRGDPDIESIPFVAPKVSADSIAQLSEMIVMLQKFIAGLVAPEEGGGQRRLKKPETNGT